jgi:hypothetical protein
VHVCQYRSNVTRLRTVARVASHVSDFPPQRFGPYIGVDNLVWPRPVQSRCGPQTWVKQLISKSTRVTFLQVPDLRNVSSTIFCDCGRSVSMTMTNEMCPRRTYRYDYRIRCMRSAKNCYVRYWPVVLNFDPPPCVLNTVKRCISGNSKIMIVLFTNGRMHTKLTP